MLLVSDECAVLSGLVVEFVVFIVNLGPLDSLELVDESQDLFVVGTADELAVSIAEVELEALALVEVTHDFQPALVGLSAVIVDEVDLVNDVEVQHVHGLRDHVPAGGQDVQRAPGQHEVEAVLVGDLDGAHLVLLLTFGLAQGVEGALKLRVDHELLCGLGGFDVHVL